MSSLPATLIRKASISVVIAKSLQTVTTSSVLSFFVQAPNDSASNAEKTQGSTWRQYEVERKVRRLAAKKCKRKGFGWKRWSSAVVYGTWGLFRDYRVPAEPRPDGALIAGSDAPPSASDAAVLQTDLAGDGVLADSTIIVADAFAATSTPDAGLGLADASSAKLLDAKVATSDGGRGNAVDGSRYDAGSAGKSSSSGCGCAIGGRPTAAGWLLIPAVVALLRPWRRRRARC